MSFDKYRGEGGTSTVTSGQSNYENESAHLTGNSKYLASPSSLAWDSQNDINNEISQSEESGPSECVSRDRSLEMINKPVEQFLTLPDNIQQRPYRKQSFEAS